MRGITEIAKSLERRINSKRSEVAIVELDEKTDTALEPVLRFQYFPATINDSYQTNYAAQQIPGGSVPIYQWVSGGPRTIAFEAIFTCDVDLLAKGLEEGIALKDRLKTTGQLDRNVDIRSAIVWLRRFMFPRYTTGELGPVNSLTYAPRKLLLIIPNSGIGSAGGEKTKQGGALSDSVYCHMTQCDVSYQMFHPSGLPKIARVQLSFEQVAQVGGDVIFPGAQTLDQFTNSDFTDANGYFGYPLKATGRARTSATTGGLSSGVVPINPNLFE